MEVASGWTNRLRLIFISSMQVDRAVLFSTLDHRRRLHPAVHDAGSRGSDLWSHGADLWLRARWGPDCHLHGHAGAGLVAVAEAAEGKRDLAGGAIAPGVHAGAALGALASARHGSDRRCLPGWSRPSCCHMLGSEFLPALEEGNLWIRATLPPTISLEAGDAAVTRMREIVRAFPEVITVTSQHGRPDDGSDASGFNNVELFCPLKPFDQWPRGHDQGQAGRRVAAAFR